MGFNFLDGVGVFNTGGLDSMENFLTRSRTDGYTGASDREERVKITCLFEHTTVEHSGVSIEQAPLVRLRELPTL